MDNQNQNKGIIKVGYLKHSFIFMVFLTSFTCYVRADYNLPLFAFAYILWDIKVSFINFYSKKNNIFNFSLIITVVKQ